MKALLMILDGWGIGQKTAANAIYSTNTPHWLAVGSEDTCPARLSSEECSLNRWH